MTFQNTGFFNKDFSVFFLLIKRKPLEIFLKIFYRLEVQSKHLFMELVIVHTATADSSAAVVSLDPICDDVFTLVGGNDRYFISRAMLVLSSFNVVALLV